MKFCEFDIYKGIYCGLCKQMGNRYGKLSRMTLSYDFTFFALISLCLSDDCKGFEKKICAVNPLRKKICINSCDNVELAAAMSMITFYYKIKDNFEDSVFFGKLKSLFILPFAKKVRKKVLKDYSETDKIINRCMEQQMEYEQQKIDNIDKISDPTSKGLSEMFALISNDATQKKVLLRLGYLIGKWVYLIDALDDLKSDLKSNSYNVFIEKFDIKNENQDLNEMLDYVAGILNITIAQIATTYELLDIKRYKSILDNIIYLGFKNTQTIIFDKYKKAS